jgi:hypothetical protein
MMPAWADYGVAAVRYNFMDTDITWLKILKDNGEFMGAPMDYPRQHVVSAIKRGVRFVTIFWENDEWQIGEPVLLVKINGIEYLKTSEDDRIVDDLAGLPEF